VEKPSVLGMDKWRIQNTLEAGVTGLYHLLSSSNMSDDLITTVSIAGALAIMNAAAAMHVGGGNRGRG
jgi:hypothetical protein